MLSKATTLEMTVEQLLKLLREEWACGAQNGAGFGNCNPFLEEDKHKEHFSQANARSFLKTLQVTGVKIEGVKATSDKEIVL